MPLCIDVAGVFSRIIHFIAFSQYAFSIFYDLNYVVLPEGDNNIRIVRPGFGGRSRFLTYWCLVSISFKSDKKCSTLVMMDGKV